MTVSSTTNKSGPYNGNGSTSAFAVTFKYTSAANVEVIVTSAAGVETTKTLNTHYTLSAPGDSGTVTFITSPDYRPQTGETVTIRRTVPVTQNYDPTTGGGITSAVIEATFDYVTFLIQQALEKVGRAPKLRATSTTGEITLPEPAANQLLGWNSGATDLENKVAANISLATVTSFIATLLDDATAQEARITLGVNGAINAFNFQNYR